MLSFLFSLFYLQPYQYALLNPDSTFCVCQDSNTTNCKEICRDLINLKFTQRSISKAIKLTKTFPITFLLYGTEEIYPDFNLTLFENYSFNIISPKSTQNIILLPGNALSGIAHTFINVNIRLRKGVYDFFKLHLLDSTMSPYSDDDICELEQDYLNIDFKSLSRISQSISWRGPTSDVTLQCDSTVNNIEFFNDQKIIFSNINQSALLDFSQIQRTGNSTIFLPSSEIEIGFTPLPQSFEYFPKLHFILEKSSKIFINSEQLPDQLLELQKYITFEHGDHTLYITSRPGVNPPKFNLIGPGKSLYNNQEVTFYSSYCLCQNEDCERICGDHTIVNYTDIDFTVIGNPHPSISYLIGGTNNTSMPTFDFEHFPRKNLTIFGSTNNQHINITGDGSDDFGFYKFYGVTIHSNNDFLFHDITLSKVLFRVDKQMNQISSRSMLNSSTMNIDFTSLENLSQQDISIIPPSAGLFIHTSNMIRDELRLKIYSPDLIEINKINVSINPQVLLVIYSDTSVQIDVADDCGEKITQIPRIELQLNGDTNTVNFVGKWNIKDASSKFTIVHGENPLYIQGNYHDSKYEYQPPLVNNNGNGPLFINEHLSNFKNKYCICEGNNCNELCDHEESVNFSLDSIAKTVIGNPTKSIEYVIKNSDDDHYPIFDLSLFEYKSFVIGSMDKHGVMGLKSNKNVIEAFTQHTFKNLKVLLLDDIEYTFHSLVLDSVRFSKESRQFEQTTIIQNELESDLYSLQTLSHNHLLTPCSLTFIINGGNDLNRIEIHQPNFISLCSIEGADESSCTDISIKKLDEIPIVSTLFGSSKEEPLIIRLASVSLTIPRFKIDVSEVEGGNSYIRFEGFENQHVLTNKLTIIHERNNIHLLTPIDNGGYISDPPHVTLVGDADYYANEVKQVSVLLPAEHANYFNQDQYAAGHHFLIWCFWIFLLGVVIVVILYVIKSRRRSFNMEPAMQFVKNHYSEEDDQLSQFITEENARFQNA